jgi:hypothetical protein
MSNLSYYLLEIVEHLIIIFDEWVTEMEEIQKVKFSINADLKICQTTKLTLKYNQIKWK